jgi:hypothetical protein
VNRGSNSIELMHVLLRTLDEAFQRKAWHGPNLRGSLRGISAKQAVWRPRPRRHNIAEQTLHTAYWKYAVRRRLTGEKRGTFPLKGSNWFPVPEGLTELTWRGYVALLADQHRLLYECVGQLPVGQLTQRPPGGRTTALTLITGIAAHDVYHAGQIQLLKALHTSARD